MNSNTQLRIVAVYQGFKTKKRAQVNTLLVESKLLLNLP
ncbi:hypothetical protein VCHENC03_2059 [Vibrio sp. HENC-03]|nr:hypothetical protein VCHENC03_2059 [Vibrio sp. HENC-03]